MSNVLRTNENLDTVKGRNGAEMPEIPLTFIIKNLSAHPINHGGNSLVL